MPLEEARDRLQHAVGTGSYGEARAFLAEFTSAVNARLATATPGDPLVAETLGEALDLLHWADRAVRAGRAHAAAEAGRLAAARRYRGAAPPAAPAVQWEA